MTTLQREALDTGIRLENLLHQLTRSHQVEVNDTGRLIGVRTDPALLAQLRHAKSTATTYAADPGASLRHERTTLNTAAVTLYASIERRIHTWAIRAGYRRPTGSWPLPEQVLRSWWALAHHDVDHRAHTAAMQGWATAIADLLDPPHRFDIDKPCPVCRAHILEVENEGMTKRVRALAGVERDPDIHQITCRSCGAEWDGLEAAQELADELAHAALLDAIARRWQNTLHAWQQATDALHRQQTDA